MIGGERFNQFIIVYGKSGQVLYRSRNVPGLPDNLAIDEKWQSIVSDNNLIRVLTVPIGLASAPGSSGNRDKRILQTGLILDDQLLRIELVSSYIAIYSGILLLIVLLTSTWLASTLLRPLNDLASYLRHISISVENNPTHPTLGASSSNHDRLESPVLENFGDTDLAQLVREAENLRDSISKGLRKTQAWTAQMAHELRTPLTILQNNLELARGENDPEKRDLHIREASNEMAHVNAVISSFLEWSAAENFPGAADDLHAIKLQQAATEIIDKMQSRFPERVQIEGQSQLTVFAKKGFLRQALSNLVSNAIQYSPPGSPVIIRLEEEKIQIIDEGPGLPEHVLVNLGAPFNYGIKGKGFGLGLAWVLTICRKYSWNLTFHKDGKFNVAEIKFS